MTDPFPDLTEMFSKILSKCRNRNMKSPLIVVLISRNRNIDVFRLTDSGENDGYDVETLSNIQVSDMTTFPINCFVVGDDDEVLAFILDAKGIKSH